ncbi:MAG: FHIPEP family type III secretion protein, partial [Pseudomonadota bacterium]
IVNFIVITRGAGRMAEVGARFALDGMPGKQLAIDSDMAAGAISHEEARERRRIEQEETTFFGSLDGASKFVKGDAVAGLLITLLNLLMGLAIGVLGHDMPLGEAAETYAILTVGDGLVSQIPAVIISIAAALLLSKGGASGPADQALLSQFGRHPAALWTVAGLLAVFAFVPGLPFLPFVIGAILLGAAGLLAGRVGAAKETAALTDDAAPAPPPQRQIGDVIDLDEIHLEFAPDLVSTMMDEATGLYARIVNMRNHIAETHGVVIPEIRLTDNAALPSGSYVIRVQGVEVARSALEADRVLVLLNEDLGPAPGGHDIAEPVFGAPARWIDSEAQEEAALAGFSVISPTEVVATHLMEVIKSHFARLFSRRALRKLLDAFARPTDGARAEANRRMLDEFIPEKVPVELLHSVLRILLEERVSIRNLPTILEAIAEARPALGTAELIAEHVRHRLGFQIVAELVEPDGALPLIQIGPDWEETFQAHQVEGAGGAVDVALPPDEFNRLARAVGERIAKATEGGRYPAIATSTRRRRFLRAVLSAKGIANPVLSFEEIGPEARPALLGVA